jgi:hypothetical protein
MEINAANAYDTSLYRKVDLAVTQKLAAAAANFAADEEAKAKADGTASPGGSSQGQGQVGAV